MEAADRSEHGRFRRRAGAFVCWRGAEFGRGVRWGIGCVTKRVVRVQDASNEKGRNHSRARGVENNTGLRLPCVGVDLV